MSKWTEIGRTYAPPRGEFEMERGSYEMAKQLAFGVTTVELENKRGKRKTYTILGDARNT